MSRLTRDGTAEPVSRDQILRHARGQEDIHFPCSADHEQDWLPYPVDPYSAICDDHTYIHSYLANPRDDRHHRCGTASTVQNRSSQSIPDASVAALLGFPMTRSGVVAEEIRRALSSLMLAL